jgi:hypothetical protein
VLIALSFVLQPSQSTVHRSYLEAELLLLGLDFADFDGEVADDFDDPWAGFFVVGGFRADDRLAEEFVVMSFFLSVTDDAVQQVEDVPAQPGAADRLQDAGEGAHYWNFSG